MRSWQRTLITTAPKRKIAKPPATTVGRECCSQHADTWSAMLFMKPIFWFCFVAFYAVTEDKKKMKKKKVNKIEIRSRWRGSKRKIIEEKQKKRELEKTGIPPADKCDGKWSVSEASYKRTRKSRHYPSIYKGRAARKATRKPERESNLAWAGACAWSVCFLAFLLCGSACLRLRLLLFFIFRWHPVILALFCFPWSSQWLPR